MFGLGTGEIVLIMLVLVIFFGASKLPQLGDSLGKSLKGFQRAMSGADDDKKKVEPAPTAKAEAPPAKTE
jgi:sec-independent protein translocase protein TatA